MTGHAAGAHARWLLGFLLLGLLLPWREGAAQTTENAWNPRTGDAWVDRWLGDMNRYGERYPESFVDELVRYHDVPRSLVIELLRERHWAPGDVYYACAMASVLFRPCREVVALHEANPAAGWDEVGVQWGVLPGTPAFGQLKRKIVPTYERWARPIQLDDELRREFPEKARRPRSPPPDEPRGARRPGHDGRGRR
jgi:hypothetical protein